MPADFDPKDHGLNALKVASRGGVVFASFDPEVAKFFESLGRLHGTKPVAHHPSVL